MDRGHLRHALLLALGAGLVAASCDRIFATRVGKILKDVRSYQGRSVTVSGAVKERIDLPAVKLYVVDDGSGAIGVVTHGRLPRVGEHARASGVVRPAFPVGNRTLVVIVEPTETPSPSRRAAPPDRAPS